MSNRLKLPGFKAGVYDPRTTETGRGRSIEVKLPSLLPSPVHVARPPLFIYGSYYRLIALTGARAGQALFSLEPCPEADGFKMQLVGRHTDPDTFPRWTKFEVREQTKGGETVPGITNLIDRLVAITGGYGYKFDMYAEAHPTTGLIVVRRPHDLDGAEK